MRHMAAILCAVVGFMVPGQGEGNIAWFALAAVFLLSKISSQLEKLKS